MTRLFVGSLLYVVVGALLMIGAAQAPLWLTLLLAYAAGFSGCVFVAWALVELGLLAVKEGGE